MGIPKYELNKRPLQVAADQEYDPNSTNAQSGAAVAQALAAIAPAWSQQAAYNPGDLVMRNGKIWRALHVIASGTSWAAADWEEVDLNDLLTTASILEMMMPDPGTYTEQYFLTETGITAADFMAFFDNTYKWVRIYSNDLGPGTTVYPVIVHGVGSSQTFTVTIIGSDYTWTITKSSLSGLQYTVTREATKTALAEEITYSALVALRNGGNLVPGKWYRITDYRCSTLQANTMAATNAFDILVRADDASHLNENAFAMHHTGDTYFQNCNLEAWQLKYCLDNDTDRFAWADDVEGKGVIFYMKDEWGNECPYDFKNIKFQRWAVTADQDHPYLVVDNADNNYGYYYGAKDLQGNNVLGKATYGEDTGYFYTFALKDLESGDWFDYTVAAHLGLKNDEGNEVACYDNHLIEATDEYGSGKGEMAKMLNNIVFFNCYGDLSDTSYSDDYSYCNNNRFLGNCQSNTFGNNFYQNSFGNGCYSNTFGNECSYNSFGNNCGGNTFGNYFQNNTFGNNCNWNSFGNGCQNNSFGNYCNNNSFGNSCGSNSFGNNCVRNTFGNGCTYNTFGNSFQNNSFGNDCRSNTFGNDCSQNSFGNYCKYITVFDGVQYCSVSGGSDDNAPVKNAQILNGTAGASAANKLTIAFTANVSYTQVAAKDSSGNLQIWNPADNA